MGQEEEYSSQDSAPSKIVSEFEPSSQEPLTQSTMESDVEKTDENIYKKKCRDINNEIMLENTKLFLGLENEKKFIIQALKNNIEGDEKDRNILITLRKIKLNESFYILSCYFSLSVSYIGRIFSETLPMLSCCLKQLIFRPHRSVILSNLPVAFRANYNETSEIIDAFEIEIQKPSDPVHQALTWSEYKKANTIKYLVAGTPDGFVTYVSNGYGGKISDVALVRESGYLDTLQQDMVIMADRGFKHIDVDLGEVGCKLLRPPSVHSGEILSKDESLYAKQIAALRIHIERVIGRIREFSFLKPHSCVDNKLLHLLDDAVIASCGLINMQKKLIKC